MSSSGPQRLLEQETTREINQLLESLKADSLDHCLTEDDRFAKLEQLKIYGRNPQNSKPIFQEETVKLLCKYAFDLGTLKASQEAMRCLANTFLLQRTLMHPFLELLYGNKAAARLKTGNDDDEFLICRILFLATLDTTYASSLDLAGLIQKDGLAESIHLNRHAGSLAQRPDNIFSSPMESLALSENLKLLYNITSNYSDFVSSFRPCIKPLIDLITMISLPEPPLQAPVNLLINALSQMDFDEENATMTNDTIPGADSEVKSYIDRLISILDRATSHYSPADLETTAVPLVLLLRKLYAVIRPSPKEHLQELLLPSSTDRVLPIGQSTSLSSRLLQLTTNPITRNLQESISGMYYELSSRDARKFIQNIGYGYAAGYLVSHHIALPDGVSTRAEGGDGVPVNPITGQWLDQENGVDTGPEMTQEEKEREAERLFVLFERLKATGVVNVRNPVEEAMRSAQVEEVDDDSDED